MAIIYDWSSCIYWTVALVGKRVRGGAGWNTGSLELCVCCWFRLRAFGRMVDDVIAFSNILRYLLLLRVRRSELHSPVDINLFMIL